MGFAMADCGARSQMPKWAGHQDVYGLLSLSGRKQKQLSYPEGGAWSTRVEVHPLPWLPLGRGSWRGVCSGASCPRNLTPEGKRALSGFRGSAPGSNCSWVPYQKAFSPFFHERCWLLLSVQAVLKGSIPFRGD